MGDNGKPRILQNYKEFLFCSKPDENSQIVNAFK